MNTVRTPTGFEIEKIDEIPLDVLYARQVTRWSWLRDLVIGADDGEVLRVTCPSKREAELASQSMRNEHTYRHIPGYHLLCRKVPKDNIEGPWYLYLQKEKN